MIDYIKVSEGLRQAVKDQGLEAPHPRSQLNNNYRMEQRMKNIRLYILKLGCDPTQADTVTVEVMRHNLKRLRAAWRPDSDNVKEYVDSYLHSHILPKGDGNPPDGTGEDEGSDPEPNPERSGEGSGGEDKDSPAPPSEGDGEPNPGNGDGSGDGDGEWTPPKRNPKNPDEGNGDGEPDGGEPEESDGESGEESEEESEDEDSGPQDPPVDPNYIPPRCWDEMCAIVRYNLANPSKKINVILVGIKGIGKTEMVFQLAKKFFDGADPFALTAPQQEWKIIGYKDAMGRIVRTAFLDGFTKAGITLIDEIDRSQPEALISINMALANKCMDTPEGLVKQHDQSMVIATANTAGTGATNDYGTANQLDASTRDRFVFILMEWEHDIALRVANGDENLVKGLEDWNKACDACGFTGFTASYRAIVDIHNMLDMGIPYETVIKQTIIKYALNKTDLGQVYEKMENKRVKFAMTIRAIQESMKDDENGF